MKTRQLLFIKKGLLTDATSRQVIHDEKLDKYRDANEEDVNN